jgi:serine/threonine protein kinase
MDQAQQDQTFVPPTPEELVPLFPAYEIESFIASGGMGAVYQARQRSLDRPVAIKILPREFGADEQFRASFEAEAKAMARLNHPNLIGVYDFGDIDGMLYIIMELVHGKSLYHSAYGVAIEQKEAARLVTGICRGLTHAHQAGILHRDIKPANILLTMDAQPKIGDFGLARPVGHEHNDDEIIYGTPGYSAPEVLNHPEAVDQRTDLYAVGVLLYELLTGQLPPDPWQPPSTFAKIDPAFNNILRRATHPSPELRYADPNELGDELEDILKRLEGNVLRRSAAVPITSPLATAVGQKISRPPGVRSAPFLVKKPSNSGAIATVVVIAVVGLGLLGFLMTGGGNPAPIASPTPKVAPPKPKKPKVKVPDRRLVTTSPDRNVHPDRSEQFRPKRNRPDRPRPNRHPIEEPVATIDPPEPIDPDPVPEPVAAPEPEIPEFNTTAFIEKGREALQSKANALFDEHEEDHAKNINRFERAAERIVRRTDRKRREKSEKFIEAYFTGLRSSNRITAPGNGFKALEDGARELKEELNEALEQQAEIITEFHETLQPLQEAYTMGLQRKADELNEGGNTVAENFLTEEADIAANSMIYFIAILKGEDPGAEEEEKAEEEKAKEE